MQSGVAVTPLANTVNAYVSDVPIKAPGTTPDVAQSTLNPVLASGQGERVQSSTYRSAFISVDSVSRPRPVSAASISPAPSQTSGVIVSLSNVGIAQGQQSDPATEVGTLVPAVDPRQGPSETITGNTQPETVTVGVVADDESPISEENNNGSPDVPETEVGLRPRTGRPDRPEPETNFRGLTDLELDVISELSARDAEVRTHEQQHQAVGGQHAGAATFSYTTGPDGVQYAVSGEVGIDVAPVANDPQATIDKMRTVRAAALAPSEPSPQDRAVAAEATRIMLQAQAELAQEKTEAQEAAAEARQRSREDAEARDEERQGRSSQFSNSVRTYEEFVRLGQIYDQGIVTQPSFDAFV